MKLQVIAIWVACLVACSSSLCAQFGVPISNRVFLLEIKEDASKSHVSFVNIREGAMVTIRSDTQGYWFGIIPVLKEKSVQWIPFSLKAREGGAADLVQTEMRSVMDIASPATLGVKNIKFYVSIIKVEERRFPNQQLTDPRGKDPRYLQKIYGASGGGICCVSCSDMTVCGTDVKMACGECNAR